MFKHDMYRDINHTIENSDQPTHYCKHLYQVIHIYSILVVIVCGKCFLCTAMASQKVWYFSKSDKGDWQNKLNQYFCWIDLQQSNTHRKQRPDELNISRMGISITDLLGIFFFYASIGRESNWDRFTIFSLLKRSPW